MDDLLAGLCAWLRNVLDDVERVAQAALENRPGRWEVTGPDSGAVEIAAPDEWAMVVYDEGAPTPAQAAHIASWDPKRALTEVDADRRLLDLFEQHSSAEFPDFGGGYASGLEDAVRLRALPYADQPGYRDEWRP
jgi:hypothetical protein